MAKLKMPPDEMNELPPRPAEAELEPEPSAEKSPIEDYRDFLAAQGVEIDERSWRRFFARVEIRDLRDDETSRKFADSEMNVLAMLNGDVLSLSPEFANLDPERQRYILAHEHGHRYEALFSRAAPEKYRAITDLLAKLPGQQISHYVNHLEAQRQKDPTLAIHLDREKFAETIAQYISGGGSFSGMIETKLNQFPPDQNVDIAAYQQAASEAGIDNLADYLNQADDPETSEAFFAHHPGLEGQYRLYRSVREMFDDPAAQNWPEPAPEKEEREEIDWDEIDYFDSDELVNYFPETTAEQPLSVKPGAPAKAKNAPVSWWNIFNFFQIFPSSAEHSR